MRIARWLFGGSREDTGIILGNDACGKTMFLYQLKMGMEVQTIPTIGFNIETIDYPDWKVSLWDIGGCDQMRNLVRHYIHKDQFILFIHDCTDVERLDESIHYMHVILGWMKDAGSQHMWILLNKQDALLPATRDETIVELQRRFEAEIAKYEDQLFVKVMNTPGLSAKTGVQVQAIMEGVKATIRNCTKPTKRDPPKQAVETRLAFSEQEAITRIKSLNEASETADGFWKLFLKGELKVWDHYTHLRAGYFVLLGEFAKGSAIFECTDEFLDHLSRLRETNPDRFRNTAHRTMTTFWLVQLQIATIAYQINQGMDSFPTEEDFGAILLSRPKLMNSGCWREYYSKELLFSPAARNNWHLPDLEPLPTVTAKKTAMQKEAKTSSGNPYRLVEFAFAVVQKTLDSKLRRGAIVKQALEALQVSTMRERARDDVISPYSETQAYFWIQYIHAALVTAHHHSNGTIAALSFLAFRTLFGVSGEEWKQYYTPSLWRSVAARMEFVLADKRPLPNIIPMPLQQNVRLARSQVIEAAARQGDEIPQLPSAEKLGLMAAVVLNGTRNTPETPDVTSHPELLLFLHAKLSNSPSLPPSPTRPCKAVLGKRAAAASLELTASKGATASIFWTQEMLRAMATADRWLTFDELIAGNPQLAWEQLPLVYYSPARWHSSQAREVFVPADRACHPASILSSLDVAET